MSDELSKSKLGPIPPDNFDGDATWRDDKDLDVSNPGWQERDEALLKRLKSTADKVPATSLKRVRVHVHVAKRT